MTEKKITTVVLSMLVVGGFMFGARAEEADLGYTEKGLQVFKVAGLDPDLLAGKKFAPDETKLRIAVFSLGRSWIIDASLQKGGGVLRWSHVKHGLKKPSDFGAVPLKVTERREIPLNSAQAGNIRGLLKSFSSLRPTYPYAEGGLDGAGLCIDYAEAGKVSRVLRQAGLLKDAFVKPEIPLEEVRLTAGVYYIFGLAGIDLATD